MKNIDFLESQNLTLSVKPDMLPCETLARYLSVELYRQANTFVYSSHLSFSQLVYLAIFAIRMWS